MLNSITLSHNPVFAYVRCILSLLIGLLDLYHAKLGNDFISVIMEHFLIDTALSFPLTTGIMYHISDHRTCILLQKTLCTMVINNESHLII